MKRKRSPRNSVRNRVLNRLPSGDLQRLRKRLREVEFKPGDMIYEPNKPFDHVYFPEEGVASIISVLKGGREIEVATVGHEGMVGLPVFLRAKQSTARSFWQVPGRAFVLRASDLRAETRNHSKLSERLHLYTEAFFHTAGAIGELQPGPRDRTTLCAMAADDA